MKRGVMVLLGIFFMSTWVGAAAPLLCEDVVGDDELKIVEIDNLDSPSLESWTWEPNEQISLNVKVMNKNYTDDDYRLELFLFDSSWNIENNFSIDPLNIVKAVSVEEDETLDVEFLFRLNEDVDKGTYYLYAKFYQEDNESICTELRAIDSGESVSIRVDGDDRLVVVRNVYGPENVTLGENVEYIAEVVNLGNVFEEKVSVAIYSSLFDLREEKEIFSIGSEKVENVTFSFVVPENITGISEYLFFPVEYNYENDSGRYLDINERDKFFIVNILGGVDAVGGVVVENVSVEENVSEEEGDEENVSIEGEGFSDSEEVGFSKDASSGNIGPSIFFLGMIIFVMVVLVLIVVAAVFYFKNKKKVEVISDDIREDVTKDLKSVVAKKVVSTEKVSVKSIPKTITPIAKPVPKVVPKAPIKVSQTPVKPISKTIAPTKSVLKIAPKAPVEVSQPPVKTVPKTTFTKPALKVNPAKRTNKKSP